MSQEPNNPLDYQHPDQRDDIEREPANWFMLPIIAAGVALVCFGIPLLVRLLK